MSCIKVSVFLFSLLLVCNTCDTTLTHVFLALIINMVTYSVIISSIGAMLFHTPDRVGRVRHLLSIRFGGKRFRIFKCSICCILIHRNLKFFLGVFVTLTTDPRQKMPQTPAPITQAQQKPQAKCESSASMMCGDVFRILICVDICCVRVDD